jgi:hypothetical protein
MRLGANGLRDVKTDDLRILLRAVHRDELETPFDRAGLATIGLLRIADDLDHLRGLDASAIKAVVIAVIAERT